MPDRPPEARVALRVVELSAQRPDLVEEQPDAEGLHLLVRARVGSRVGSPMQKACTC